MQINYQVIAMYRNVYVADERSYADFGKLLFVESGDHSVTQRTERTRCKTGDGTKFQITMLNGAWRMAGLDLKGN